LDGNSRKNPLIVKTISVFNSQLDQLDQEIKQLEDSDEYKTFKNRGWGAPVPTEKENGEWKLLNQKLDELKRKRQDCVKITLSTHSRKVKKSHKIRNGYETAIKDERLLLSSIARKACEKFLFHCEYDKFWRFEEGRRIQLVQ
jgi:hypothetical protein